MGTASVMAEVTELVLPVRGELVGPGSPFEERRASLRKEYAPIIAAASAVKEIFTHEDAERVTGYGRLLQAATKESEAFFKTYKQQIDELKKPVLEAEKTDIGSLKAEKDRLGALQLMFDAKVRREQEKADRKAREEAERIAREDQLARAIELESSGDLDQAETILEEDLMPLPVFTQAQSPARIAGKVQRVDYAATVENLMELVKAVAAGKAPLQALCANTSFINAQARSYKEGFSIPGCKLQKEEAINYRS